MGKFGFGWAKIFGNVYSNRIFITLIKDNKLRRSTRSAEEFL